MYLTIICMFHSFPEPMVGVIETKSYYWIASFIQGFKLQIYVFVLFSCIFKRAFLGGDSLIIIIQKTHESSKNVQKKENHINTGFKT